MTLIAYLWTWLLSVTWHTLLCEFSNCNTKTWNMHIYFHFRACNLKYISIQWEKPRCYGSAHITGYRIYIDGICEAVNGPDQMIYNYTTGKFCTEYSFQVQAITDNDLCSKPSDPLLVKWPGVIPPTVRQLPSDTNSSLKVGWDIPYTTEGIKIKHYKV